MRPACFPRTGGHWSWRRGNSAAQRNELFVGLLGVSELGSAAVRTSSGSKCSRLGDSGTQRVHAVTTWPRTTLRRGRCRHGGQPILWHGERIAGWRLLPSFDLEHSTEDRLRIVQRRVNPHVQGSLEQLRAQLVRPADQSQRRVQDRHPVAQPLGLLKPVRGQEDRHPALAKRGDLFTPLLAGWSIWVGIAISARSTDRPRRPAAQRVRQHSSARDRRPDAVQGDHAVDRPRTRSCGGTADRRRARVAGGSGDVRPRTAGHRSPNVTRIPGAARRAISLESRGRL